MANRPSGYRVLNRTEETVELGTLEWDNPEQLACALSGAGFEGEPAALDRTKKETPRPFETHFPAR